MNRGLVVELSSWRLQVFRGEKMSPRKSRSFTSSTFHAVAGWGVRIVWVVSVGLFALFQLHIIPEFVHDPGTYLVVVVTLLLFMSEILNEWRRDMFARLQMQSGALESIQQNIRGGAQLFSLEASIDDLRERLKKVEVGEKVVIEHFGLDMTFAWDPIDELIRDHSNLTDVEYRLLMLSPDRDNVSQFDDEVKTWLLTGRTQADKIKKELAALQISCQKVHRSFTSDLRTYTTIPLVHGLRVTEPFHAAYIAICRWDSDDFTKFRWGRNTYHRIIDGSLSGTQSDILDVFNGNFLHFWNQKSAAQQDTKTPEAQPRNQQQQPADQQPQQAPGTLRLVAGAEPTRHN